MATKRAGKAPPAKITAKDAEHVDPTPPEEKAPKAAAAVPAEPGPTPKERRAEINRQFAEADDKARAALTEEAQVGLQVRGY